jgi:hypothetical protein
MNIVRPSILTPVFALLSIRRVIAVVCVLAILAQTLVMTAGTTDEHHHDGDVGHQQMLDVSHTNLPHAMGETSHDCHNGSHCHGCVPVFGLSAEIPTVLLDSQHDFVVAYSNTPPRYSPASPFRPPIV